MLVELTTIMWSFERLEEIKIEFCCSDTTQDSCCIKIEMFGQLQIMSNHLFWRIMQIKMFVCVIFVKISQAS